MAKLLTAPTAASMNDALHNDYSTYRALRFVLLGTTIALSSCSGSGSSQSVIPNGTVPAVMVSSATREFPAVGGFSGSATFASPAIASALTISVSTTPSAAVRKPASGTLSEFYYVNIVPKQTVTLPTLPSITLAVPASYATAGKQFYYGLQVPAPTGVYQQYRTEGPGTVAGQSVKFASSAQPYTMTAGVKYTFVFFALSTNNTSAAKLLFVANRDSNAITAYPLGASGDTAPVRTIAGPATGIVSPLALTSDSDGDLVVACALSGSTRVETFAHGATGDVAPLRSFTVPGRAEYVAIDPSDGSVAVEAPGSSGQDEIHNYAPDGSDLRHVEPAAYAVNPKEAGYLVDGIAYDSQDRLIVGGNDTDKDNARTDDQIYSPHASAGVPPLYHVDTSSSPVPIGPFTFATTYAPALDHIISVDFDVLLDQQNAPNAPVLHTGPYQLDHSSTTSSPPLLAIDDVNERIFIGDSNTDEIRPVFWNGGAFVSSSLIRGISTGLAYPVGMTVAMP